MRSRALHFSEDFTFGGVVLTADAVLNGVLPVRLYMYPDNSYVDFLSTGVMVRSDILSSLVTD